jgi:hypothetical protein
VSRYLIARGAGFLGITLRLKAMASLMRWPAPGPARWRSLRGYPRCAAAFVHAAKVIE